MGYANGQCKTCAALGRDPFYCHYGKIVEDCRVQVARPFQTISKKPLWLEAGMVGRVIEVDEDLDRQIEFVGVDEAQWVQCKDVLSLVALPRKINGTGRSGGSGKCFQAV